MSKRIQSRRANGQFRRTTLKDFGIRDSDLSDGKEKVCGSCGRSSRPIMREWTCQCGHRNAAKENE